MLEVDLHGAPSGPPIEAAFTVQAGSCLALAGPSGAGKSTILRMIAGLAAVGAGSARLSGKTLLDADSGIALPPEERGCGLVFQDYALFQSMSAWRNVAYSLRGPRRQQRVAAIALLERFDVGHLADASIASLSGGERQRVALARALASKPRVLLLDEPLAALDVRTRAQAAAELAALVRELEVPALLVTHSFFDAALLGEEIAVIEDGQLVQRGSAAELAAAPASGFVADFTGANVLRGTASIGSDGLTRVALEGGGVLLSTDRADGEVAASIQPWEVALRPTGPGAGGGSGGSERNRLTATVVSIAPTGGRLRVGLALPQPLAVDLTEAARSELALEPGSRVTAVFKASATRLYPR